jgi:acyl transferase domain-containing protein/3-hydroxymyristoyl/3-hydroxydecanoyl-(acyl carrier protein) dehydratase
MERDSAAVASAGAEPIAIVGFGGVFPGARSLDEFWQLIERGVDTSRPVPAGRWVLDPQSIQSPVPGTPDRVLTDRGCFIEGFQLDPAWLNLPADLLRELDPSVHLLLEAGRNAFASAKMEAQDLLRIGVVMGNIVLPTEKASRCCEDGGWRMEDRTRTPSSILHPPSSPFHSNPSSFLARALRLGSTAFSLDAACASSLYALKLACDELRAGRADAMLAGGLSRPDSLYTQMGFSQLRALAPSGRCAPFDAAGSGLIVGEGAGVLVLKRLADALRDGDTIHAVIRGIGLSNDLEGNLLSPSSEGQLRALKSAYAKAGWSPDQVDFIECHATGTPVGDAVEFASLSQLWQGSAWQPGQCVLGAVKANIGHLLTAAGSASLIKVLLALKRQTLPATANFRQASPKIPLAGSPFQVLQQSQPWPRRSEGTPRRAAINGFGFGGINAHVLIEEWLGDSDRRPPARRDAVGPDLHAGPEAAAPIAIVGLAAHVGACDSLAAFWQDILAGTGAATGPIADLSFPLKRFRIPPRELAELLPQQALMLEVARAALADAATTKPAPERAAVFIGLGLDARTTDYHHRWVGLAQRRAPSGPALGAPASGPARTGAGAEHELAGPEAGAPTTSGRAPLGPPLTADRTLGALAGTNASRIAKEFHFGGPAFTVSAEELSGVKALELAVRALESGEADQAIAGAVDFSADPRSSAGASQPPVEGAVAFVLKRLADARRDGDRIYAVVTGIGGAPASGPAQADSLQDKPGRAALPRRLADQQVSPTCGAGSVAGLLPVLKSSLSLYREVLPAEEVSDAAPQPWVRDRADGPRQTEVTVSSADGHAMRVALEACETQASERAVAERCQPVGPLGEALFVIESATQPGLTEQLEKLRALVEAAVGENIECLARRWFAGNGSAGTDPVERRRCAAGLSRNLALPTSWRMALVAQDTAQLLRLLDSATASAKTGNAPAEGTLPRADRDRLFFTPPEQRIQGGIAFVFPGAGNTFPEMGRELALQWPEILRAQDRENERLASQMCVDRFWNAASAGAIGTDHRAVICGQVALGTMVSDLAVSFGIKPDAVIGYSLGEATGLFAMRAWTARDEMLARVSRSTLFSDDLTGKPEQLRRVWRLPEDQPVEWLAGLVDCPAADVRAAIAGGERIYILIVNTPGECVIGGDAAQVRALVAKLGCHWWPLEGVSTVHCELLKPFEQAYRELHLFSTMAPAGVRFFSGGWGREYVPSRETAAEAIVAQASDCVDFPRVVRAAYDAGTRFFLEMGPGGSCSRMIAQILEWRPHVARSLCVSAQEPVLGVLRVLAQLVAEGVPVDLRNVMGEKCEVRSAKSEVTGAAAVKIPIVSPLFAHLAAGSAHASGAAGRALVSSLVEAIAQNNIVTDSTLPEFPARARETAPEAGAVPVATLSVESAEAAASDPLEAEFFQSMAAAQAATVSAHEAYLSFTQGVSETLAQTVKTQLDMISALECRPDASERRPPARQDLAPAQLVGPEVGAPALDRAACLEFARGAVANVLGAEFAPVDGFPTRVRLPDEPLMLVDRILEIHGAARSMTHGRVVTEHDILPGAWYLDCGRIPTCIAVEAGQADLFLSGYLGIDFQTKGLAVYRLLDAKVCFHCSLPGPGAVIHYDIHIDHFFRQGSTWLFRFNFEATVNGAPLLTMTDGCAGFFSAEELAGGRGIVRTAMDLKPMPGKRAADWEEFVPFGDALRSGAGAPPAIVVRAPRPLVETAGEAPAETTAAGAAAPLGSIESYSDAQLEALRAGDLAGCFGSAFAKLPLRKPITLPSGRMKLVHRIPHLDPVGGRFGLGLVRGEADIHPDDWFLTCHFVDDRVMPGTLMFECCLHTLRVFLLRLGWVVEDGAAALEPVPGVVSQLKCRGQVLATTRTVAYEVAIKEIGYRPEPYVIADALMYADGKAIVEIGNMSLRYAGVTREDLKRTWLRNYPADSETATDSKKTSPPSVVVSESPEKPALYGPERILAFAIGKPSEAFGEPYRIFDEQRRIARLPGPPYQFLDRITEVTGEPFKLVAGGVAVAEYDVPPDAWYFAANRQGDMPFAVLLEIALQPCGWLAAYCGSALTSEVDLSFRNLGGKGTQFAAVLPGTSTLSTCVKLTKVSSSAGMIIQWFDLEVRSAAGAVYQGDTYFGFFPKAALAKQEGIRDAKLYQLGAAELAGQQSLTYPSQAPFAGEQLRMVDAIESYLPNGGPHGLGFIRATKPVQADEWFFKAHFYQDPVVPGSLGLESFLQLLKFMAIKRWGQAAGTRWEAVAVGVPHEWLYRGQVIPKDKLVTVEALVTAVDEQARQLTADGFLSVDGRTIYGMKHFTVRQRS